MQQGSLPPLDHD